VLLTEHDLDGFRAERLGPEALLRDLERSVHVLFRLGIGVGKSLAADRLLGYAGTYRRFDLVLYAAPSWDIIRERSIVAGREISPVPWTSLRPRPVSDCGALAMEWEALDQSHCAAYGKGTLCRQCPIGERCFWPEQFKRLEGLQLIVMTEQQLVLNRSLVWVLKSLTGARRVLLILDEARLLNSSFEISVTHQDLMGFQDVLRTCRPGRRLSPHIRETWLRSIESLLDASPTENLEGRYELPDRLNRAAFAIQEEGVSRLGTAFRYLGYELPLIQWAASGERWKDSAGVIRFIARPYVHCHVLILSAHLSAAYAAHRLGKSDFVSPFESTRFQHTGTRIVNLRNRIGADSYFKRNHKQILDVFAVVIARNISERRSTLLVSRKKSKAFCATYLKERLQGWGITVDIIIDNYDGLPESPDPAVIPIVHYGILGVNDFTEYESAYSLNSYYVSTRELNRHVQDAEPEQFRVRLKIVSGPEMMRRVEIEEHNIQDLDHTTLGNMYLQKLEVDPVVQAAGRVRFLTRPREVVFFQMHDLEREVGTCATVRTLAALRTTLGIPAAKELDALADVAEIQGLLKEGFTAEDAATKVGISRRTLFRRLQGAESAKKPNSIYVRVFGTPPGHPGGNPR
jgi:hypothetical protein